MSTPSRACSQCAAPADADRIFCVKCGAALQLPRSLLLADSVDANTSPKARPLKRGLAFVIEGVALIAGIVFWFSPITTNTGILWFGASILVALLFFGALSYLDDDFVKENKNEGYWPKPLDWGTPLNIESNEKNKDRTDIHF